jgi:hypothetical protein
MTETEVEMSTDRAPCARDKARRDQVGNECRLTE